MQVVKITKILEQDKNKRLISLCTKCGGHGWVWSDREFGDLPGDQELLPCLLCGSTGRTAVLRVECEIVAPHDFFIV